MKIIYLYKIYNIHVYYGSVGFFYGCRERESPPLECCLPPLQINIMYIRIIIECTQEMYS